jgi:lipid A 3-O-deacylase
LINLGDVVIDRSMVRRAAALACAGVVMTAAGAQATAAGIIDEIKAGVMAHDITLGGKHVESGADINGEILFTSPGFLDIIGAPRPHLGGWVNSAGNTDAAYFGLTWGLPLIRHIVGRQDGLTILGSLGGAVHDGYNDELHTGRKRLGSTILFRESVELAYQLTSVFSVSLMVDHISNANLGTHNAGITNAGARVGFKF